MSDLLIRNVSDEVIAAIDARARRLGLSRTEYLRRALGREQRSEGPVSVADLADFADRFGDLADDDVMSRAWE